MPPSAASSLALFAVLSGVLAACGTGDVGESSGDTPGAHQSGGASGASGDASAGAAGAGSSSSAGSAAGGSGSPSLTTHDLASGCRERCAAAEPAPPESSDCDDGSVGECVQSCEAALADTDEPCARCKLDALSWLPASGGCGEWECVCSDGYAELPGDLQPTCAAACESTLARRAATRLDRPVPPSLGRLPDAVVELPELGWLGAIAIDDQDRAWVTGGAEDRPIVLARLDLDTLGTTQAIEPPTFDWAGRAGTGFALEAGGDALLSVFTGERNELSRYAPDGTLRRSTPLPMPLQSTHVTALSPTPQGNVLVTFYGGGDVAVLGRDGAALFTGNVLLDLGLDATQSMVAIGADARWLVAGVLDRSQVGGEGLLLGLDNAETEAAPALREAFRATFVGNENEGSVSGVVRHADGSLAVYGRLREDRDNGLSHLIYSPPFVARLSADGEERWRRAHDDIVPGEVSAVAFDAAGNLYAVGHEDPVSETTVPAPGEVLCTVYGCDGLVVRKWSPDGELLWEYQHREATSAAAGLALDSRGRLFVVGHVAREETTALALRFDQP